MALLIIPQDWSFSIGNLDIHSWQIYLAFCGVPVLCGTACLGLFPESPKFLMSQGRNEEALKVFQQIYALNSGKSPKSYPVSTNFYEVLYLRALIIKVLALIWRATRALFAISRFLSRNSLVFEISRYLAKKLENRTNIDRLIYIKDKV